MTTAPKHFPTVTEWNEALARAGRLGVRLVYHDAGHISIISCARDRQSSRCTDWAALLDWLTQQEQDVT